MKPFVSSIDTVRLYSAYCSLGQSVVSHGKTMIDWIRFIDYVDIAIFICDIY